MNRCSASRTTYGADPGMRRAPTVVRSAHLPGGVGQSSAGPYALHDLDRPAWYQLGLAPSKYTMALEHVALRSQLHGLRPGSRAGSARRPPSASASSYLLPRADAGRRRPALSIVTSVLPSAGPGRTRAGCRAEPLRRTSPAPELEPYFVRARRATRNSAPVVASPCEVADSPAQVFVTVRRRRGHRLDRGRRSRIAAVPAVPKTEEPDAGSNVPMADCLF